MSKQSKNIKSNFYDELQPMMEQEEAEAYKKTQQALGEKIDYLIHRVFEQNEHGKELLSIWHDSLILTPTVEGGIDVAEMGIREGMKRFIRNIILTIRKVENG